MNTLDVIELVGAGIAGASVMGFAAKRRAAPRSAPAEVVAESLPQPAPRREGSERYAHLTEHLRD